MQVLLDAAHSPAVHRKAMTLEAHATSDTSYHARIGDFRISGAHLGMVHHSSLDHTALPFACVHHVDSSE